MVALRRIPPVVLRLLVPLALLLLVAPLVGAQGTVQQAPLPPPPGTAPPFALYVAAGLPAGSRFVPLDPATLADLPHGTTFTLAPAVAGDTAAAAAVFSADGSTAAGLDAGDVAVWDLRTGKERARFFPDASFGIAGLSRDGSRVVISVGVDYSDANLHAPAWEVFDSATGKVLARIQGQASEPPMYAIDSIGWRLYQLVLAPMQPPSPARPPHLVAYDLATDNENGQVALPGLRAGSWPSGQTLGNGPEPYPVPYYAVPGLAVSPDGHQIAVVHPERDAVTLIDTRSLRVERTVELDHPASLWQRLTALVPFWPHAAAAKAEEGTFRSAVFGPDGRHLYVFGDRSTVDGNQMVEHSLGLAVVDLARGTMTKPILTDQYMDGVAPAPDGRGVYASSYVLNNKAPISAVHLWRLDATTLTPRAERIFPGLFGLLIRPAVPNTRPGG